MCHLGNFPSSAYEPCRSSWFQTIPWNLTGSPSLCVPVGFTPSKLPLGVQLVGRPFEDPLLLRIGVVIEDAAGVTSIRPEVSKLAA